MLLQKAFDRSFPAMRWLVLALLLLGCVCATYGLIAEPIYSKEFNKANLEILGWVLLCMLPCLGYGFWRQRRLALTTSEALQVGFRCLCVVTLLVYVQALGPAVCLSVALLALASLGLGSRIYRADHPGADALRLLLGLALISALVGWSLALPIHRPGVYLFALAGLCAWNRAALKNALRRSWSSFVSQQPELPTQQAWAKLGLLMLVSLCAIPTWLPSVMSDDLNYHLGMSYELAENARYRFDIGSQIWAVAPWGGDTLYAMMHVLSGEQARGGVNVLLQLTLMFLLNGLLIAYGVQSLIWRTLAIALAISQPLWVSLGLGMQTETATSCVLAGLLLLDLKAERGYVAAGVLTGFALALKASNVLFLMPLAWVWLSTRWRQIGFVGGLCKAAFATAVAGGSSYVCAYLLSGNPLFPLPFLGLPSPSEMVVANSLYTKPLVWNWLYELQFLTSKFNEGKNGSGGLQWLVLLPLLLALPWLANPRVRWHAIALLVSSAVFFLLMKYLRYVLPALMLLSAMLVPCALALAKERTGFRRTLALLCIAVIGINVLLQRNASWPLFSPVLRFAHLIDRELANQNFLSKQSYAVQLVTRVSAQSEPIQPLTNLGTALFAGQARGVHWHDPEGVALWNALVRAPDPDSRAQRLDEMLEQLQPTDILLMDDQHTTLIAPLLETRARLVAARPGEARWWRLRWPKIVPTLTSDRTGVILRKRHSTQIVHWQAQFTCDAAQVGVNYLIEWLSHDNVVGSYQRWQPCDEQGTATINFKLRSTKAVDGWRYQATGRIKKQRWHALNSRYHENDYRARMLPWLAPK